MVTSIIKLISKCHDSYLMKYITNAMNIYFNLNGFDLFYAEIEIVQLSFIVT